MASASAFLGAVKWAAFVPCCVEIVFASFFPRPTLLGKHLFVPLVHELGVRRVDVFFCVPDSVPLGGLATLELAPGLRPSAVFTATSDDLRPESGISPQFMRFRACYRSVRAWATERARWDQYTWFVRSRPDLVMWAPLPGLNHSQRRRDTVYARARMVGPGVRTVRQTEIVLQASWESICGRNICVANHSGRLTVDLPGICFEMDDQFAYVPRHLAPL